ncbi:MAG TPA: AMP-binding protein [Terriglobia bacterium]|nr:AMP-binding protein [Terriglobia bacterium]
MQVEAFLESSAARLPDRVALVCEERRLTYQRLEEDSNRLAHALTRLGVARGDRVGMCLDNGTDAVITIFAVLKAGAVLAPLSPAIKPEKLAYIIRDSGLRVLVTKSAVTAALESHDSGAPELKNVVVAGPAHDAQSGRYPVIPLDGLLNEFDGHVTPPAKRSIDMDLAALLYTSGTTGRPKGVMLSHFNMVAAATSVIEYLRNDSRDVILNVLPLSFSYGLYQALTAVRVGATFVLERSFAYPHTVIERLVAENVTGFAIVPTIASMLLQLDLTAYSFPALRYLTNAGAGLPMSQVQRLRTLFPGVDLFLMYGLTECKRVSYLPPDEVTSRPGSVGKPMPNVEAYVVDEHGYTLPANEVGELVVRGSNVMRGYWNLPDETARTLREGPLPGERVLHTGDLFRIDEEGYLYFVGRRDDMIKSRGEKVSPSEVENVLYQLEGVSMAAVVGVPDYDRGMAVKAFIVPAEGVNLNEKDVLRHCAARLEAFMIPKEVEFRQSLPRNASGKIDKRELISAQP